MIRKYFTIKALLSLKLRVSCHANSSPSLKNFKSFLALKSYFPHFEQHFLLLLPRNQKYTCGSHVQLEQSHVIHI